MLNPGIQDPETPVRYLNHKSNGALGETNWKLYSRQYQQNHQPKGIHTEVIGAYSQMDNYLIWLNMDWDNWSPKLLDR